MNIDYDNSLVSLSNSLLKFYECETHHKTLKVLDDALNEDKPKNIVLVICDGMGSKISDINLNENDFLRRNRIAEISSVFPPTTTAALTSICSGLTPCEHGWLGWDSYIPPINETVTLFLNTIKDTNIQVRDYSITKKYLNYKSIFDSISEKCELIKLESFVLKGSNVLQTMIDTTKKECKRKGKKFIYFYYDEPDCTCHELGYDDKTVVALYKTINDRLESMCASLKDTTVIIVADHGHLTCEPITLSKYQDIFNTLERTISIEGRACNFFVKESEIDKFKELFNKYFNKDFDLYTREEVINNHFFGKGKEHPLFRSSLGDFLAIAKTNKYFRYNDASVLLKSMHAGTSEMETKVPLILSRKK